MPRRKRNKKWISTVIILILLVIAGVVVYFVWDGYFRDKIGDNAGKTGSDSSQISDKKESGKEEQDENVKTDSETDPAYEKKAVQYDGDSPNELDSLTGSVSYASVNAGRLSIRVSVDQYLEEGTCKLVLVQGGEEVYQETAEIMGDATTSTCRGFDVPTTSLSSGEVQFTVYLLSGNRAGEVSGGVEI